jgi:hypothetical protein
VTFSLPQNDGGVKGKGHKILEDFIKERKSPLPHMLQQRGRYFGRGIRYYAGWQIRGAGDGVSKGVVPLF